MTKPTWILQTNLGNKRELTLMKQACVDLDLLYQEVQPLPFSEELPDVPTAPPTIFYGSASFTHKIYLADRWSPGVFFDAQTFRFSSSLRHYEQHMVNANPIQTTMEAFAAREYSQERRFFIRPDRDEKEFAGQVYRFGEFRTWYRQLDAEDISLSLQTPIVVADPIEIAHEWRLFMVDGKFISGSHYQALGRLHISSNVPQEVISFAEARAAQWSPHPIFVMDVAEVEGTLKILENNGFNSSGFYDSDIKKIFAGVSEFIRAQDPV